MNYIALPHMYKYKSSVIKNFGYDKFTKVDYAFNSLGYRSKCEFNEKNPIIILGNTMSFGLGVEYEKTYAGLLEKHLQKPVYNLSWGCYGHTINEQISFLERVYNSIDPSLTIFQLNNLNRYRMPDKTICFNNSEEVIRSEYDRFIERFYRVTKNQNLLLLHWDNQYYDVELPKLLIYNKYVVDSADTNLLNIPGEKTHKLISLKIQKSI